MSNTKPKANGKRSRKRQPRSPVRYTDKMGDRIFEKLAQGKTLTSICKGPGMPSEAAVRQWALNGGEFGEKYARAREIGYNKMADEITDIADNSDERTVNRDRLRIDARKWILSKALPKIYGDKRVVDVDVAVNGNIRYMSDDELRRIIGGDRDIPDIEADGRLRIAAPTNGSGEPH
jgi:hypothetical protein